MVDRKKTDKGISKLPDVLICDKILSRLPTKDAVRTSALSTKWRNHWQLVPALDLDSRAFSSLDAFVNFGDRFFDSHRESWFSKLKLHIHDHSKSHHLSSWIDAVTKRKIQQLEVCFDKAHMLFNNVIPMSIYTCETLVQLRLYLVVLGNVEVVSLPCLKMMYLESVYSLNNYETIVEKLISGSPVLEDLTIIGSLSCGKENVIQVRSQTLKRIRIHLYKEVMIDAPLLQYFKTFIFTEKKNFKIVSSGLPAIVDIQVLSIKFDKTLVSEILTDISKARDLAICRNLSKGIFMCMKSGPLLQLRYLSRLNASYYISHLELLPTLLESCPNLQYLKLEEVSTKEKETSVMFSRVPQCLISSLKFVILKRTGSISECQGEMELVRYLLENSRILQKLTLLFFTGEARSAILSMPRCSTACQIF